MPSALGPTALLRGVLGQGKREPGLSGGGFFAGTEEAGSLGTGSPGAPVGYFSYPDTRPSPTGLHLHPHPEPKHP